MSKKWDPINVCRELLRRKKEMGTPMGIKLFLTLSLLVATILIGVIIILVTTGTFTAGIKESKIEIDKQLVHLSRDLEKRYGEISVNALELSTKLSKNIERELLLKELNFEKLRNNPKVLNDILVNEYETCVFALDKANCSGVFIILNETVNPKIPGAEKSRAGFYVKKIVPSLIKSSIANSLLMRGNPVLGRNNSVPLHPEWRMEFNIEGADYFYKPLEASKTPNTELSRMFYWSPAVNFEKTTEKVMFCSVPLLDSNGNAFGVCGFEISSMVFKSTFMPDNIGHQRIFSTISPFSEKELDMTKGFFAGGYLAGKLKDREQKLIIDSYRDFNTYTNNNEIPFMGLHREVKLYPNNAVYGAEKWAIALMMPKEDMVSHVTRLNMRLVLLLLLLFVCGMAGSYYLSKRYIQPFARSIELIKNSNFEEIKRTNIYEIDDLIEFLSSTRVKTNYIQDVEVKVTEVVEAKHSIPDKLPGNLFDEFVKNTKTLTPAEKAVFDLYVEGHTAKEITEILHLSINTIKTHNKRIYMKLDITSREELLLYVNMLKEAGRKVD